MIRRGRRAGAGRAKRDPWKAAFVGLAALALAAGVTWALLGSSFLVVRTVRTTGSTLARAAVLRAARIQMGTPLIRIDTAAIARRVERIRYVQVAKVTRSWPDGLVIWTKRRTPTFALRVPGGYDVLDSFGVVLRHSVRPPEGGLLPIQVRTAVTRHDPAVLAAGSVVRSLPAWLRAKVTRVRADGPADVILVLRGGSTVQWGGPAHASAKAAEVAVLLRSRARYYDVSDPSSAVSGTAATAPAAVPSTTSVAPSASSSASASATATAGSPSPKASGG